MKFIHIADVHLFSEPLGDADWEKNRPKEIEETFEKVIDICNEKDIDLLLIAGGLFDKSPTLEQIKIVDEKLGRLEKARTVMIAGSCDYIPADSEVASYKFNSRTVLIPPGKTINAYLKGINTCVTGFSYAQPEYTERVLENINPGREDAVNILLGHGGGKTTMPFRKEVIAKKGFDYVAMGYIRKPVHILRNRMAYAGSLEPLSPEETGRHGIIMGEITDQGTTINWDPIARRSYVEIVITLNPGLSNDEIVANLEEKMMKLGNENIYTITLKGFSAESVRLDLTRIKNRFNILEVKNLVITETDKNILKEENDNNVLGGFIKEVERSYSVDDSIRRNALRYGLEALIMAGDNK